MRSRPTPSRVDECDGPDNNACQLNESSDGRSKGLKHCAVGFSKKVGRDTMRSKIYTWKPSQGKFPCGR